MIGVVRKPAEVVHVAYTLRDVRAVIVRCPCGLEGVATEADAVRLAELGLPMPAQQCRCGRIIVACKGGA